MSDIKCPLCGNDKSKESNYFCDNCFNIMEDTTKDEREYSRPKISIFGFPGMGMPGVPFPFGGQPQQHNCSCQSEDTIKPVRTTDDYKELFPAWLTDFGLSDLSELASKFVGNGMLPQEFMSMVIIKELRRLIKKNARR